MIKAYVRYHDGVLVPMFQEDAEALAALRTEHDYMVSISVPRNVKFHRKFFALLGICFDNMPDHIRKRDNIHSIESLLSAIKIAAGHFDVVMVDGKEITIPRSISFAKMDNAQFNRFYNRSLDIILETYLVGTSRTDIIDEIESQFASYK